MKWSKRHKKTFGKKTKENDSTRNNFRYPPKPDSYYTKVPGHCRWCDKMITKEDGSINERRNWHEDCSDEYMFYFHSAATRDKVYERDRGRCNYCEKNYMAWEVDHIRPLAEQKGLKPDELDWSYWQIDNLQTLCYKCHKEKSGKELKNKFKMIREKKSKVQIKKLKTFL